VSDLLDALTPQLTIAGIAPLAEAGGDEARYRELVENANDVVYAHDLDGNFTSVNKAIHSLTGYSREEVLGFNLRDLLTGDSHEVAKQMIAGKLGGEEQTPYEITVRGKDGSLRALEVSTRLMFRLGRPVGVLGIARDVSERRRAESHLRLLRSVVVNANDAVLIAQGKPGDQLGGKIVYVNEAFSRMTGHSPEDAVGRTPRILLGPLTNRDQLNEVRDALARKQAVRVEMINYRKDGSAYWVDVNFVPITEASGEFTHWVAVQRETTERKRAEDLERDRNRVLEMVARNGQIETILNQLAEMVERQCPDLRCSVLLLRNGELVQVAGATLSSEAVRGFQDLSLGPALGALKSGRLPLPAPRPPTGSSWSVPILSASGATLGAFAVACGVQRKPSPEELGLISKSSQLAAIAIEQRQLADKLAYQAQHDTLTGLPNRALFEDRLHRALAQARRQGWLAAVLFVDLDRFKQINDTLGHPVGDLLLQQVAHRLEGCIRRTDTLARMGGDEFTVLLTELHDQQYVLTVAQKLLDALQTPFQVDTFELFVTASIGVSVYPRDGRDAATLQRNADSAMYCAKNRGKNNFQLFVPEINASALESLEIENALRRAMENDEFQLRYQPQVSIDGGLTGLEALLVWNHPKLGVISPRQFIPVAEECGLIVPIGNWVLKQACTQATAWRRAGFPPVKVAVNVSVTQFMRAGFADAVAGILEETGFDAASLELELTEGVVMNNVEESNRQMRLLRSLGVSLALDDFGTGYSSLSYLRNLPIDTLKIDQSFLDGLDSAPNAMPLLKAIVVLAHSLNLCVVAEGVETEPQLQALRLVGCDRVQGYLTGEPISTEGVTRLLGDPRCFSSFSAPAKDDSGKKPRRRFFFTTN
jgi:diguanylate cyclase (GGDEF)-like protein/PAS domain S-box-containing protein